MKALTLYKGEYFNRVGYKDIYIPTELVNPGDAKIKFERKIKKVPIESEYVEKMMKKKEKKRGKTVYQCPYCFNKFSPGRKDHAIVHIHGKNAPSDKRKPSCVVRRVEEPDFSVPATKALIEHTS